METQRKKNFNLVLDLPPQIFFFKILLLPPFVASEMPSINCRPVETHRGLLRVITMSQLKGKNFGSAGIRLSSHRSRVSQNEKRPTVIGKKIKIPGRVLHTMELSCSTCYHLKQGKPKAQIPSKL